MGTCALVAASDFNARHFQAALDAGTFDAVWAVDAGYAHLTTLGCTPDMALGDFDSLGFTPACAEVREYPSHKDKSDLEIAFDLVVQHGFDHVVVYGALGQRLDHTIANLQAGAFIVSHGGKARLLGENEEVLVFSGDTVRLPRRESCSLSLFALGGDCAGVTVEGAKFDCRDVTLSPAFPLGVSNVWESDAATVSVRSGTLAVVMSRLRPGEHI